ncbi:MAG: hypothetical protein HYT15_04585 [Candidatus Magasanikbacteria bacterium]|nr:hypothetical protein [Candidatus Magasanikbacteria bacterium]
MKKLKIDTKQLKGLHGAIRIYRDSFGEFKKLNENDRKEITNRLIDAESQSSVEIEEKHKFCPC